MCFRKYQCCLKKFKNIIEKQTNENVMDKYCGQKIETLCGTRIGITSKKSKYVREMIVKNIHNI
jgi:hypothetical protein